jgi:hypothetical protein
VAGWPTWASWSFQTFGQFANPIPLDSPPIRNTKLKHPMLNQEFQFGVVSSWYILISEVRGG